jgi:geranylgeranyl pyrophosphate synthase
MKELSNIEEFIRFTKRDLDKKIASMIDDEEIASVLEKGKKIRPLLAQLTFKACTQGKETPNQYQRALEGGVVIELAHAASLVHDDVVGEDKRLWWRSSVGVKKGTAQAILTGHKLLISGFNIALKHGKDWAKLYVKSWNETVDGELDGVDESKNGLKTAILFSSVCKAGVMEADMSGDILELFENYGREIGNAYQLANELLELTNGENKTRMDNFTSKLTKSKFSKDKVGIQGKYIEEIKKCLQKAEELGDSEMIPDSPYKSMLKGFPRYIINEVLKEINITI